MKKKILELLLRIIIAIIIFAILTLTVVCCAKCVSRENKVYEDGYFQYIIVGENSVQPNKNNKAVVAIIGFTSSGRQQEVIDFPREIDDKPVQHISYRNRRYFSEVYYELESDNLKKVYIHENIKHVHRDAFAGITDVDNLEIMFCAPKVPFEIFADRIYLDSKLYLYKSVYEPDIFIGNIHWANTVFINNYSTDINEGYYSLDYIKSGEKIPVPVSPVRNGYEFTGWYTEPECINAWDFDVSPDIEEDTEFRLYAGWRFA